MFNILLFNILLIKTSVKLRFHMNRCVKITFSKHETPDENSSHIIKPSLDVGLSYSFSLTFFLFPTFGGGQWTRRKFKASKKHVFSMLIL